MIRKLLVSILLLACGLVAAAAITKTVKLNTELVPGDPVEVTIIEPEGYPQGTTFPTVYLLNGFSGNNTSWTSTQPDLPAISDKYGMVMVMPDGRDSWYWDSPKHPEMKMESFIINELVPYVDQHYPTKPTPDQRAITGLSMGGHGALWLAMRHSDVFGNAGSTSGGVDIRPFPKNWKMAYWLGDQASNQKVWDQHTVINLVPTLKPGQVNIIFDCGSDDFFAEVNDNLHQALLDAKIPHDYTSRPGNHSHTYWRNAILYQLLYFNESFRRQ